MKSITCILAILLTVFVGSNAQETRDILDGKTYEIQAWDITNTDLKTPKQLIFKSGMVDAPVCHEYGFFPATYEVYEDREKMRFKFTSESPYEGSVIFNGIITDEGIEGTYVWRKSGREDLHYEFEGTLE